MAVLAVLRWPTASGGRLVPCDGLDLGLPSGARQPTEDSRGSLLPAVDDAILQELEREPDRLDWASSRRATASQSLGMLGPNAATADPPVWSAFAVVG